MPKKKLCKVCKINEKPTISHVSGMCNLCASDYLRTKNSSLKPSVQEEIDKFSEYGKTRWDKQKDITGKVYCQNCSILLGIDYIHKQHGKCISHILSKGAYINMYYDINNSYVLCPKCHGTWESGDRRNMRVYDEELILYLKRKSRKI